MALARKTTVPLLLCLALLPFGRAGPAWAAAEPGGFRWPVQGALLRPFEPPTSPFGAGHRGIDIAAPFGTPVQASAKGTVAFAGWVAGSLFVSIDHRDQVRTTYSWLSSVSVVAGQQVVGGALIGTTGHGHPVVAIPHLHFGVRISGAYVDPLLMLSPASVVGLIRLAPFAAT